MVLQGATYYFIPLQLDRSHKMKRLILVRYDESTARTCWCKFDVIFYFMQYFSIHYCCRFPLWLLSKLERRLLKLNMVTAPFPSMSFILGSIGETVALANNKDKDILGAKFDLNKVKSKRHNWGVF